MCQSAVEAPSVEAAHSCGPTSCTFTCNPKDTSFPNDGGFATDIRCYRYIMYMILPLDLHVSSVTKVESWKHIDLGPW